MTSSPIEGPQRIEELALPFDPTQVQARVLRRRRRMRARLTSLIITVVLVVILAVWKRDQLKGAGYLTLFAFLLGGSTVWFVVYLIGYLRARHELNRMGSGLALRIDRTGVEVGGTFVPWPAVRGLAAAPGGLAKSPLLRLDQVDGPSLTVPLDQLAVKPATLDTTARAYSAGRHGVDLSRLDS